MAARSFCTACGKPLAPNGTFCAFCGRPVPSTPVGSLGQISSPKQADRPLSGQVLGQRNQPRVEPLPEPRVEPPPRSSQPVYSGPLFGTAASKSSEDLTDDEENKKKLGRKGAAILLSILTLLFTGGFLFLGSLSGVSPFSSHHSAGSAPAEIHNSVPVPSSDAAPTAEEATAAFARFPMDDYVSCVSAAMGILAACNSGDNSSPEACNAAKFQVLKLYPMAMNSLITSGVSSEAVRDALTRREMLLLQHDEQVSSSADILRADLIKDGSCISRHMSLVKFVRESQP